ncbi:MAG: hypothetical protein ABH833_01375 [Parcubacteria group bacterium]
MSIVLHKNLASGRWYSMTLMEQLGNIGSEVGRARASQNVNESRFNSAVDRALELFDLTFEDKRWYGRLLEVGRAREVFCDAVYGGKLYDSSLADLEKYFMHFALMARK